MQDMTSFLRFLMVVIITAVSGHAIAQGTSGAIQGTIIDDKGEPVMNAAVQVLRGGISKGGTVTDFDGNYTVKPLEPGRYDVKVNYVGYKQSIIKDVLVQPSQNTEVNSKLQPSSEALLDEVVITEYKVPLIDKFQGGNTTVKTSEEIEAMATRNTSTMVSTSVGAYSERDGGTVQLGGARGDGTLYIIDGVQVYGDRGINMSQGAIDQIQVMTSGISAKYGDALGGVVTITTKGITDKLRGNVLLEHSVDGYNHNLANFTLSGPLFNKKIDTLGNKKPVVGFFLAGDFWYDEDRSPEFHGSYGVKDDVLENIRQNPLVGVPNQSGVPVFRNRAETVTGSDLELLKKKQNAEVFEGRVTGRLDFQLSDNLNMSAGGSFNYRKSKRWARAWALFAPEAIPDEHNYTGRGFIRLTQSFKNANNTLPAEGEVVEKPLISNAFYSIQADYQIDYRRIEDPTHGEDIFNYGYVGKFNTEYQSIYSPSIDSVTGLFGQRLLVDRAAVGTQFERSEMNPLLANYTSYYFNNIDGPSPGPVAAILGSNALINGAMPLSIYGPYSTFLTTGQSLTGYSKNDVQQYSIAVDASFDLQPGKTRHSIEFGLYYQQRVESFYNITGASVVGGIWQYMRLLTNTHIGLDRDNPVFVIDGQEYTKDEIGGLSGINPSPSDTIYYNRKVVGDQSTFDKNLRDKLGVSATDYIAIDELDPSVFSVDMFSADEILNNGNPYANYSGYDYKGNKVRGQVNFNDFFTKKDENGNYTRDIGSFRPNYIAGYILDKFQFKDVFFNVGLRVERYDANTKVLKDPYSLYGVNSVGDARGITDELGNPVIRNTFIEGGGIAPGNIGDEYVVYVNNNEAPNPQVVGYRNGDDWYDPLGRLIDPALLSQQYNNGSAPQPYLVDNSASITDSTYDPNNSFTDYKPQINVMPRISFNFPVSDEALFYAHYDVLVQRPKSNVFTSPASYFNLTGNQGGLINNPDLKPQKMFDYEVGFKQKLSDVSAITLSAFYKERKDMIQVRPYLYAWPTTYYTYGNRDFSTTKGMTVKYDMRRKQNLRLDIAYTLQFANGTGSNTSSAIQGNSPSAPGLLSGFVSAGLPNIRTVFPLDNDVRHNIVTTIDYRYAKGKGPIVAGMHILQNAGANLIFRTRSGEPYTRYSQPVNLANVVDGQVNGARLPWHYMLDLKVDKDFRLAFGKKDKEVTRPRRDLYLNAYVLITNLLNTRDILRVDGYTGRPDDDGYLSHPNGIQTVSNQFNAQSYVDLYSANLIMLGSTRLNLPRRINVGLSLNF